MNDNDLARENESLRERISALSAASVRVGNFYLVDKEGRQKFTGEDEEVLVLFASQAAVAMANARAYQFIEVRSSRP